MHEGRSLEVCSNEVIIHFIHEFYHFEILHRESRLL
jgi:hypothetical protein